MKVYPPIGVARLGNSTTDFFIGPEVPGQPAPPPGGYKDAECRVKRQAARFRLFGFDAAGNLEKEVTAADGTITWVVHLANTKGSWRQFSGLSKTQPGRNGVTSIGNSPDHEIDPGSRTLAGPNQIADFDTGKFLGVTVRLGEARTDADGRLMVLGGFGKAASPTGNSISHYANNDGWYDDVSDGPVRATVVIGGTTFAAAPAWVICGPPDFAPPVASISSLYDVLLQRAIDDGLPGVSAPAQPSFVRDIEPILRRIVDLKRVNAETDSAHFTFSPLPTTAAGRAALVGRVRNPNAPTAPGSANMPFLWDDEHNIFSTVTKTQYAILQKWTGTAGTDWVDDSASPPPPPTGITPEGLTRAALETCVGVALFPGIEASWLLRDDYSFSEPFRLNHAGMSAGDVTKQMAVPWQSDFYKCAAYSTAASGGQDYAWWPAQRPDDVYPEGGGSAQPWEGVIVTNNEEMVDHWHKLGFVVEKSGVLVETERRTECQSLDLVTDRSHFSKDEVAGALAGGSPARFDNAMYVITRGLLPSELGITTANPTPAQLAAMAPSITITRSNGSSVPGMSAAPHALLLQDTSLPANLRQRFTFVYRIEFANVSGFQIGGVDTDQTLTVEANKAGFSSAGELRLLHQANPFMLDGPTHWLSTDLRVFQIEQGQSRFGVTMGSTPAAASTFIKGVLNALNGSTASPHPFDQIATGQEASRLELSEQVNGQRVFNFAVARVRYRGDVLDANDVQVFFRLFTTGATGIDYDQGTTYRRSPTPSSEISLLGIHNGDLVTIPCYAEPRVDTTSVLLTTQTDPDNKRTISAGTGEVTAYFGCWLDFNQTTARFPLRPSPADGPWTANLKSLQELIRGSHQCLVAELRFANDPIPPGAAPGGNDNLSQRNLLISESANPGEAATRTVQHTFEIKATRERSLVVSVPGVDPEFPTTALVPAGPDELMIRWNDLPPESGMTLYLPGVDTQEILRYAGQNYERVGIERVDDHTIRCLPADVTYVPLPSRLARNAAGLLTIELPEGVRSRQVFAVTVHQISARAVIGAFQLTIPVRDRATLLPIEIRKLSVLRHIQSTIPVDDRWWPVFGRYLGQLADRVDGFGGNSAAVDPSPAGTGRDAEEQRCTRLGWLTAAALAFLVTMVGWHPGPGYLWEVVAAALVVVLAVVWWARCSPDGCAVIGFAWVGLALGIAVLGIVILAGAADDRGAELLAMAGIALALLSLLAAQRRCRPPRLP